MRSFLRLGVSQLSILALCMACTAVGCGGEEGTDTPPVDETGGDTSGGDTETPDTEGDAGEETSEDSSVPETSEETSADTAPDDTAVTETAAETSDDTAVAETSDDTAVAETADDTAVAETAVDAADDTAIDATAETTPADGGDETGADAADADAAPACTDGTLCSDDTVCVSGTCTPCTSDTQCSTAKAGTLCYGGKCLTGTCKPKPATNTCSVVSGAPNSICCSTATTAGSCFSTVGRTSCCADSDCTGTLAKCDTASHTCACPAPTPGEWHVSPTGSDTETLYSGNGSAACPFKTITKAITKTLGTTAATTIVLAKGTATTPNVYGVACTGGAPCDSATLTIPSTFSAPVTIKGAGARNEVVVTLDTDQVFSFGSSAVSVASLTIRPTKAGGIGILYDAASATAPGTVTDTLVQGSGTTGAGILVRGSANPTLGGGTAGGLRLESGTHGILVQGTAAPKVTGVVTSAPTIVTGTATACVRVENASTTAAPTISFSAASGTGDAITLQNCGSLAGISIDTGFAGAGSTIERVTITRAGVTSTYRGIDLVNRSLATVKNSSIQNLGNDGIQVTGPSGGSAGAKLVIAGGVISSNNTGSGVRVTGLGVANIDGLTARGNTGDGIVCNTINADTATGKGLKLRNSVLLNNTGNGLHVVDACSLDLGTDTDAGKNIFNTIDQKNVVAGVCVENTASAFKMTTATWTCGSSATATCGASGPGAIGSPTKPTVLPPGVACVAGVDLSDKSAKGETPPPQYCCKTYTP